MRKQNILQSLLLPAVCLAAFMLILLCCSRYCMAFKEQISIFFFGPGCLTRYAVRPALLASAIGDLLTRFFMAEWAAVAISMAFIVLLWLGIGRFMHLVRAGKSCLICLVPVAMECAFMTFPNYPLSATVGLTAGMWAAVAVAGMKNGGLRCMAYLAGVPLLFVLAGGPASVLFALILIPVLGKGGIRQVEFGLRNFLLFAVSMGLFCIAARLYGMHFGQAVIWPVTGGYIVPEPVLIALNPVLLVLAVWVSVCIPGMKVIAAVPPIVSLAALFALKSDANLESSIRIGSLGYHGEWDKVREIARSDGGTRYGLYFYNLSYAREGRLPDALLSITQSRLSDGLFLSSERGETYLSSFYWSMGLLEMGDFPQANDAALLGQTVMPGGYSSRMMRTLAEIAIASGEYDVALKYLDIMSRVPGHAAWASALKKNLLEDNLPEKYVILQRRASHNTDVMFAQGDIRTSLRNIADANPANKVAADYLMCAALLEKKINSFIGMYERWYNMNPYRSAVVPELYEQALLVNVNSRESLVECAGRYRLSQATVDRYMEFLSDQVEAQGNLDKLKKYSDTYWYYIMSVNLVSKEDR